MKKILTAVALLSAITCGIAFATVQPQKEAQKPLNVVVGGSPVTFNGAQPQVLMGRIVVPLRGIFEKIGAYVEYDPALHLITAHYQNQSIEIHMGNKIANVNGAEVLMEVPASIIEGSAMVPLRFLAESLGATVQFDQPTNTVAITAKKNSFGGKYSGGI